MISANKHITNTVAHRQQAVSDAVASVKAEGLSPSGATAKRLNQYIQGKLSAHQLYKQTLTNIKARNKQTAS